MVAYYSLVYNIIYEQFAKVLVYGSLKGTLCRVLVYAVWMDRVSLEGDLAPIVVSSTAYKLRLSKTDYIRRLRLTHQKRMKIILECFNIGYCRSQIKLHQHIGYKNVV